MQHTCLPDFEIARIKLITHCTANISVPSRYSIKELLDSQTALVRSLAIAMEILNLLSLLLVLVCGIALPSVHSLEIEFSTVSLYSNRTCYGGSSAGLGSTDLRLEYRNNASGFQWVEIAGNIPIGGDFSTAVNIPGSGCVVVRLVQEEHGGGNCNCWELTGIMLNLNITT